MRKAALPVVAALILMADLAAPLRGEVKVETDRFTGDTTVKAQSFGWGAPTYQRPGPSWTAIFSKGDTTPPPVVFLSFEAKSPQWIYLNCHEVHLLKDGQPFLLPDSTHVGHINGDGTVKETILVGLKMEAVKELEAAKKLEFQICTTVVVFNKKEMADIGAFINAVEDPQHKPVARK